MSIGGPLDVSHVLVGASVCQSGGVKFRDNHRRSTDSSNQAAFVAAGQSDRGGISQVLSLLSQNLGTACKENAIRLTWLFARARMQQWGRIKLSYTVFSLSLTMIRPLGVPGNTEASQSMH